MMAGKLWTQERREDMMEDKVKPKPAKNGMMVRFQLLLVGALAILFCGCESVVGGRTYADRVAQEKSYLQFAQHEPINHQVFAQDRYLDLLDLFACEKFNFAHCYLRAMVTESENHRLGVGFCNDVGLRAAAEGISRDAATQKVRDAVLKDDESRPSAYENAKRWPRIQAWYEAYKAKDDMDAKPKVDDLEYFLFLRRQKGLSTVQAAGKSPMFDEEYQKYLKVRYPSDKKSRKAATTPVWKLKRDVYCNALALLGADGESRPIVANSELRACLNALRTGFNEELSEKRQRNPNFQLDQEWYAAMNAQFDRIESILKEVGTCESFESEQDRRIRLARDYNKASWF